MSGTTLQVVPLFCLTGQMLARQYYLYFSSAYLCLFAIF